MSIRVAFEGGPADGTIEDYPLDRALPSLYWSRDEPEHIAAIYRRTAEAPDPDTGAWRYAAATS